MKIFHRRVEDFFDCRLQPVDFVDEQHVARLQIGQDRRQITGPLDHRPGRRAKPNPELARDDLRQSRFAQTGRAMQQHVIQSLTAVFRRLDEYGEIFP